MYHVRYGVVVYGAIVGVVMTWYGNRYGIAPSGTLVSVVW